MEGSGSKRGTPTQRFVSSSRASVASSSPGALLSMSRGTPASQQFSLLGRTEKAPVVVDLGFGSVKCGFAKEASPRLEFHTPENLRAGFTQRKSPEEWMDAVLWLFKDIYFRKLHTKPRERRVHLCLHHYAPTALQNACLEALLVHFQVPSVLISSTSGTALFPTGLTSGIVVDIGSLDIRCIAVHDGIAMRNTLKSLSKEDCSLDDLIREDTNAPEESLTLTMLHCLLEVPQSLKIVVIQNIVVSGSLMLGEEGSSGFEHVIQKIQARFERRLQEDPIIAESVTKRLKFSRSGIHPRHLGWCGASIASALDSFFAKSVSLHTFSQFPFVFDDSNLMWNPELQRAVPRFQGDEDDNEDEKFANLSIEEERNLFVVRKEIDVGRNQTFVEGLSSSS